MDKDPILDEFLDAWGLRVGSALVGKTKYGEAKLESMVKHVFPILIDFNRLREVIGTDLSPNKAEHEARQIIKTPVTKSEELRNLKKRAGEIGIDCDSLSYQDLSAANVVIRDHRPVIVNTLADALVGFAPEPPVETETTTADVRDETSPHQPSNDPRASTTKTQDDVLGLQRDHLKQAPFIISDSISPAEGAIDFKCIGEFWQIGSQNFKALVGFRYLCLLLQSPNKEIASSELVTIVRKVSKVISSQTGEMLDRDALLSYKQRLKELSADRQKAERDNDEAQLVLIDKEKNQIEREVSAASSAKGSRRFDGPQDRARGAVSKAIRRAIKRIGYQNIAFSDHLKSAIKTGNYCVYRPDKGSPFQFRF